MITIKETEDGCKCPQCLVGTMSFPRVEDCSCHISPPCSACVDNKLTCDSCAWEFNPLPPKVTWRSGGGGIFEQYTVRPVVELGGGKRIFDFDYSSASGSTMEYLGKCTPNVTEEDILAYFGSGTFGHRGPSINNGRFTFAKITD